MEWVKEEIRKRKVLQEENPELFAEVAEILLKHDLIKIDYEVNPDEYEPEAGTIIPRLPDCSNAIEARKVIHAELVKWFDDELAGKEDDYTDLASDIWQAWVNSGMKIIKAGG